MEAMAAWTWDVIVGAKAVKNLLGKYILIKPSRAPKEEPEDNPDVWYRELIKDC